MKRVTNYSVLTIFFVSVFFVAGCASKNTPVSSMDDSANESNDTNYNDENLGSNDSGNDTENQSALTLNEGDLQTIYFDFNLSGLNGGAKETLKRNYTYLSANPGVSIVIEGHCDDRGTSEYNIALGERRAQSIRNYLVSLGIEASRINVISYGEERPEVTGSGESVWSQNRRGEFRITSN